jgi:phenylacetate-CoA ligase
MGSIEGREDDLLYTIDGKTIGRLDPVFKSRLPIREAQIVQEAVELIRVRYVPGPGFGQSHRQSLIRSVQDRMGAVKVVLDEVDFIPRASNGKFRAVICNLSPAERERIRRAGYVS